MTQTLPPRFGAIFGAGRSGTTWLGAIAASHPEVVYRFEPFHRARNEDPAIAAAEDRIVADDFGPADLPQIYAALLKATPDLEKPPFFSKHYATQVPIGRGFLWPLARRNAAIGRIFQGFYTPKGQPFSVFKEVGLRQHMVRLLERTEVPIVYLVRHPCAVLYSLLRGQEQGVMPSGRRKVVSDWLDKHHDPALAREYKPRLEELTIAEIEALLWRMEVELVTRALSGCASGIVLVYEELTEAPHAVAERMFAHFGYPDRLPDQCTDFIDASIRGDNSWQVRFKYGEIGIKPYFSVFRNPNVSRDTWKEKMPAEQRQQILAIVRDSKAYALGADKNFWD